MIALITKVEIAENPILIEVWSGNEVVSAFGSEVEVVWFTSADIVANC